MAGDPTPAAIAVRLSKAQRAAIYPGPGNPKYGRGAPATMRALGRAGVVTGIFPFAVGGRIGAHLTPTGQAVRAIIAAEDQRDAG